MNDGLAIAGRSGYLYSLVRSLSKDIVDGQFAQEVRFVQLGEALLEIRTDKHFLNWGYTSFGHYIKDLTTAVNKERSTLYGYCSTVEALLPVVGRDRLQAMGINKALLLKQGMTYTGNSPSENLLLQAINPAITAETFKNDLYTEFKIHTPTEEGIWREIAFYADNEEWLEIEQSAEMAKRVLELPNSMKDPAQWAQIILAWAREFASAHPDAASKERK